MAIDSKLIDELLKDCQNPEDIVGKDGLLKQLQKQLLEKALEAEMTNHLGYEKNQKNENSSKNHRNGRSSKTIKSELGNIEIEVPRDRESTFEPQIIKKRQTRFKEFDQKIIALYARGLSTRDIKNHLKEIYDVDVSESLISDVTDEVIKLVLDWQARALDAVYPIVYFDALFLKVRDEGHIRNKAVYLALGVNMEGQKELLGMWIQQTEGAKFWLKILNELNNRGLKDILIACVDGLKGLEEAILAVYPHTQVQLCIVHMIRNSVKYVSYKDKKTVVADLKKVYKANTAEIAQMELENFKEIWDKKYPLISNTWKNNWPKVIPFFAYPDEIRKAIYTTNAIESLNRSLRKVMKNKGVFPTDESVFKLLFLAINNISKKWTMPIRNWGQAMNQFGIIFEERLEV